MYNFAKIKDTYDKVYLDYFSTKDVNKKKIFEFYLTNLKNSPILKEEFNSYISIQNSTFTKELDAQIFISENVEIIKNLDKKELFKIHKILIENLNKNGYDLIDIFDEKTSIFEGILNIKKNSKNLGKINESISKLRDFLLSDVPHETNLTEGIDLPVNILSNLLVNKFNSKYGDLEKSTKDLIKILLNGSDKEKSDLYESTLKDCFNLINEQIKETSKDLELKEKLLLTKEKLLEMNNVEDNYIENFQKLIELKNSF